MAERRYSFHFSLPEGCVLFFSLLLTSAFVFLCGIYVGKAGEARKGTQQQARIVRVPVPDFQGPSPILPPANRSTLAEVPTGRLLPAPPGLVKSPAEKPSPSPQPPEATVTQRPAAKPSSRPQVEVSTLAKAPAEKSPPRPPVQSSPRTQVSTEKPSPPSTREVRAKSPAPPQERPLQTTASPPARKSPRISPTGRWSVQVQETKRQEVVEETVRQLRAQGYSPVVIKGMKGGEIWYRVRVGKFARQEDASSVVAGLRRSGKFTKAYMISE